jgi:hypothetical protein
MKLQQIKLMGGYTCEFFSIEKNTHQERSGCCGKTYGDDFVPVCSLTKTLCPGIIQCPRLDVKTKSELIKQWRIDLQSNAVIDPSSFTNK